MLQIKLNWTKIKSSKLLLYVVVLVFRFIYSVLLLFQNEHACLLKKYHGFLRKFDISSHISKHFTFCKDCFIYIVRKEILHSGTRLAYGHAQHVSRGRASPITQRLVASRNNNLINFMYTFLSVQPLLKESLWIQF